MPFAHEMTAVSTNMPARNLRKGHVVRFCQDTITEYHPSTGRKPEIRTNVFVGTVSDDAETYGDNATDVHIDLCGVFNFTPDTPVEVVCDPLGMRLPFVEEMPLEYVMGRASHALADMEYIDD
jgi:hypothetical protein